MRKIENFQEWNEKMIAKYNPDKYHRSRNPFIRMVEARRTHKLLKALNVQPNEKVLDVGCGAGNMLDKIKQGELYGIDISETLLKTARERLGARGIKLYQGDAECFPEEIFNIKFNKIFCSEVIEHVEHPERVIDEMLKAAQSDAKIVISFPNEDLINKLKEILVKLKIFKFLFPGMSERMGDEWHIHEMDLEMFRKIIAGKLRIIRTKKAPFNFLPLRFVVECEKIIDSKKKVLMIAPTSFFSHRGCHIRIFEEATHLMSHGYKVRLVTYHLGEDLPGFDIERVVRFPWYNKVESGASWHKIYLDLFLLIKTVRIAYKFKPDILHCHLHEGALIGLISSLFYKAKIIFDSQGSLVDELSASSFIKRDGVLYNIFLRIEKLIYRKSSVIIVSNKNNYDILINNFGINSQKVFLITDGVNLDRAKPDMEKVEIIKEHLDLDKGRKVIVYLGTLNAVEGIDELLELMRELKKIRQDWIMLLMGYPNVYYYNNRVKDLGLDKFIKVLGRINYSEAFNYLTLGQFAISLKLPTTEGNGKILNSAALGQPVICYDHFSNRYILGELGLYLNHNNNIEINAQKVSGYLDLSDAEIERIRRALQDRTREELSWQKIIIDLINVYNLK